MGNFVNPIIDALVKTTQLGQEARQRSETERSNKVREQQQKDQLKQAMDDAKQRHDLEQQHIQLLQQAQQNALDAQHFQERQAVKESVSKGTTQIPQGVATQQIVPQGAGGIGGFTLPAQPGNVNIGGVDIPAGELESPQARIMRLGAEQEAINKPRDLRQQEMIEGQNKRQDEQIRSRDQIAADTNKRFLELQQNQIASNERIARLNNATRLQVAAGSGIDPGSNVINDIYVTGNRPLPGGKVGNQISQAAPEGWTPVSKNDTTMLDGIPQIQKLFDSADKLSAYSSNTIGGGYVGSLTNYQDTRILRNELEGQLGTISRYFGGERGVLTERDIDRAKKLFNDKTLSRDKLNQQLNEVKQSWFDKIGTSLNKFPEDQRNAILSSKGIHPADIPVGTMPDFLKAAPQKNKLGHARDDAKSIELGYPVYK